MLELTIEGVAFIRLAAGTLLAHRTERAPKKEKTMPYNDPEQKRQWEQAHRQRRNAQRRLRRAGSQSLEATDIQTNLAKSDQPPQASRGVPWWAKALFLGVVLLMGSSVATLPRMDR